MIRSLQMKLVLILVLLIVSVMTIIGTYLLNSVVMFYINSFAEEMAAVFTADFQDTLRKEGAGEDGSLRMREVLYAYAGTLGIDNYRTFYVLSMESGAILAASDERTDIVLEKTPNLASAMNGKVGGVNSAVNNYIDFAIPVLSGEKSYIVYIRDDKQEINDLIWILLTIVIQAMLFGLLISVLLSFLLAKTITIPIEGLTKSAKLIAAGEFSTKLPIHSGDEIGTLTMVFNDMALVLKETIEAVEGERSKLSTLFLHMTDGMCAFDQSGSILHMNPAAEGMLSVAMRDDLKYMDVLGGTGVPFDTVNRLRPPMYTECDYSLHGKSLKLYLAPFGLASAGGEAGEQGVMAVIHDITEQKRLEEVRREFVANVSHELRTPLTNVKSYTETLIDDENVPPHLREKFLGVVLSETDRMSRIVKDLLTLSRLDYGKVDWRFSRFSMPKLLEHVHEIMLVEAIKNKHFFGMRIEGHIPDMVGDRERLEQVLINIISNAIKYTSPGGRVLMKAGFRDGMIWVAVRDNGIGIPREDLPRLFDRFYRVDKARSRERGGTGLGLAIARDIVEHHNGTINIASEPDKGTAVVIELPADLELPPV